jgi:hypothetical protein
LILDGCAYSTGNLSGDVINELKKNKQTFEIVMNGDFNFYEDYTNGVYLKDNNLEEIKKIVSMKH